MAVTSGVARTDDGLDLYFRIVGSEGPWLVCCNGVGVSTFFFKYVAEHFGRTHRVLLWDYRGHGRSALPPEPVEEADLSIERNARDLFTVMDHVGADRAVLTGHSMGCQVILEAHKQQPDRVTGLVPMFGTFGRPLDTFMDSPMARPAFDVLYRVAKRGGRAGSRLLLPLYDNPLASAVGGWTGLVDIDRYMDHLVQMDPRVFLRMVSLMADHVMGPYLPGIRCPVLIIAGERDLFTPLHRSHTMHELIEGSELMVLADASHAAIVEHPESINRRIERFFAERLG
jgi:pimeloyl-ACP methyl ester carboxylesterase